MSVWEWAASFAAGYACRSHCGGLPLSAKLRSSSGRPFKLSVVVHGAAIEQIGRPGVVQDQRPYISISVGDKSKETELGDWSKERGQWNFKETLILEVVPSDEICIAVSCTTSYDFWLASVSLGASSVGEAFFTVASVLPRLRPEDRDVDGVVWATPVIPIEARVRGNVTARVFLSFETCQAPSSLPRPSDEAWGCCSVQEVSRWDSTEAGLPEETLDALSRSTLSSPAEAHNSWRSR